MENKNRIFLGGTWAKTTWRTEFISNLIGVSYFNPVVEDWTAECQAIEMEEKEKHCNVHFYCITKEMIGVFSIAEVIDSVHTKGKITILQVIPDGFSTAQLKSLKAVVDLVVLRGGIAFIDNNLLKSACAINFAFSDCEHIPNEFSTWVRLSILEQLKK